MEGHYRSRLGYEVARARGALHRAAIAGLVRWRPLEDAEPGYTVVIGCNGRLLRMLGANLDGLARQDAPNLRRVVVVTDCLPGPATRQVEDDARGRNPGLPLEFLYYDAGQIRRAARLKTAWVYAWLSWCLGIAEAKTRHVVLHDFDAILLDTDILERRHRTILGRGHQYVGIADYNGNGVVPDDGLATTFEMILDAQFVRARFRPVDLYNRVTTFRGRTVNFDTLLDAQARAGTSSVEPIDALTMVHPSQVICEYTELTNGHRRRPRTCNVLFVPYFTYVSGYDDEIRVATDALRSARGSTVRLFDSDLDLGNLTIPHVAWIAEQARRLETAVAGGIRPPVRDYLAAIEDLGHSIARGPAEPAGTAHAAP